MPRLPHLDGTRGLAAVIVFLHHFSLAFLPAVVFGQQALQHDHWEAAIYRTPLGLLTNGNFAVHVFLVISGVVVGLRLLRLPSTRLRLIWVVRRYFRLMVPVLASVLLAFILIITGATHHQEASEISHSSWLVQQTPIPRFINAIAEGAVMNLWLGQNTYNSSLWMMKYLWHGALFTLLVLALSPYIKRGRLWLALIILLLFFPILLTDFFIGFLLATRLHRRPSAFRFDVPLGLTMVITGLFLGSFPLFSGSPGGFYQSIVLPNFSWATSVTIFHGLGAVAVVVGLLSLPRNWLWLDGPWLRWLGQRAFAIFLVHVAVIISLSSGLMIVLTPYVHYGVSTLVTFTITSAAVLLLAYCIERWIERPMLRFLKLILPITPPKYHA